MAFDVDFLKIDTFSPNPQLLKEVEERGTMKTPGKIKDIVGDIILPEPSEDKPYLFGCMVLSFDGKMGFDDDPEGTLISKENRFDAKGAKLDFWMMNVCRCYADGVIMCTGTLRVRMNKLWYAQIHDEDLLTARKELGKKTDVPLSIIASIDGKDVPFTHAIFSMENAPVIATSLAGADYIRKNINREFEIITEPTDLLTDSDRIRIVAAGEEIADTVSIMKLLRGCGLKHISVEAPGYIWTLIRDKVLDEYFLNYSGVMAGGNTALGTWGPATVAEHSHAALLKVGFTEGFVFTRQKLIYNI